MKLATLVDRLVTEPRESGRILLLPHLYFINDTAYTTKELWIEHRIHVVENVLEDAYRLSAIEVVELHSYKVNMDSIVFKYLRTRVRTHKHEELSMHVWI